MKEYIQGLLADPTFNLGVGLLQASGPRPITSGIGDVLAGGMQFANQRQQQAMQMQAARDKIASRQQVQGLLGGSPQGQLIGSLLGGGYDNVAASLMGNMTPTSQNLSPDIYSGMQMLGVDTPEQFFTKMQDPSVRDSVMSAIDPQGYAATIESQRLAGLDDDTRRQEVKNRNLAMDQTIGNIVEAMDINERIADKLIATGDADVVRNAIATGANLWNLAKEYFDSGKLTENEYSKIMAERQNLNALFAQIPMEMMSQYDGGTTNAFLTQWNNSKASENNQPLANNMILSRFGNDLAEIASAYDDGPYSENSQKLDKYINRFNREFMPGGPAPQKPRVLQFEQLQPGQ